MPAAATLTSVPHRFAIRLPRALWIGLSALVLVVVVVALQVAMLFRSHTRQQAVIRQLEQLRSAIQTR